MAAIFLLLVSTSRQGSLVGAPQPSTDVTASTQPALGHAAFVTSISDDLTATDRGHQVAQQESSLRVAIQTNAPAAHVDIALPTVEYWGEQAVARVVMYTENGEPAYRQTRFYRRTAAGWLSATPDAAIWGAARNLETPSFVFHFRQHDAQIVIAVAPQVDALYTTLRRNFGLPVSPAGLPSPFAGEKLVIDVSVTQPSGQGVSWFQMPDQVLVPSPTVYLAPVELTDVELLAQSIALPLLEQSLAQASEHYAIGSSWQPLLNGLRLWQLWDLELPLSGWREDMVKWLYLDLPTTRFAPSIVLPDRYRELCAEHKLWLLSPLQLNIPLVCAERHWEDWYLGQAGSHDPLTRLDQFSVPTPKSLVEPVSVSHPGQTVALATFVEYAVATYGRERLPALVAGLGQYESWETLLPAVFGVSAAEFEAGWQAYLMAQYGL